MTPAILAELVMSGKESPHKCTLTALLHDPRFLVTRFDPFHPTRVEGGVLLHPGGPALAAADLASGLVLVDGSWRYAERMVRGLEGNFVPRSLPGGLVSAYPRRAREGTDPAGGLASIEALYAALWVGGRAPPDLLARYRWREDFLARNAEWFRTHAAEPR